MSRRIVVIVIPPSQAVQKQTSNGLLGFSSHGIVNSWMDEERRDLPALADGARAYCFRNARGSKLLREKWNGSHGQISFGCEAQVAALIGWRSPRSRSAAA
jgi:hypothetical protein